MVRPRRRLRAIRVPDAIVLDSGAIRGALEGGFRVLAELSLAEQLGIPVRISVVTLVEVMRGHRRDALIRSLLRDADQDPVTGEIGQAAGELLGRSGRSDTVDAIVALTAERAGTRVRLLTGDPDDLRALTEAMPGVAVVPV